MAMAMLPIHIQHYIQKLYTEIIPRIYLETRLLEGQKESVNNPLVGY